MRRRLIELCSYAPSKGLYKRRLSELFSLPLYGMLFILCGEGINSIPYKGRENNSLSLLRIGKHLTLYEPSPPLLLKKEEEDLKKDKK